MAHPRSPPSSRSADAVAAALAAATGGAANNRGVLLVCNNYTGDRWARRRGVRVGERPRTLGAAHLPTLPPSPSLNFGAASAAAVAAGTPVETVFVADDVALLPPPSLTASDPAAAPRALKRARGLAGCVLVLKIAGAAAAAGRDLPSVAAAARRAAAAAATVGAAATACSLPGRAAPDRVPAGALELGLGLHGEPGVRVVSGEGGADALAASMLAALEAARPHRPEWPQTRGTGTPAALLVNDLGGCAHLEAAAVAAAALRRLDASPAPDWRIVRVYVGPYATSLDMRGVSLTLLPVCDDTLTLLDAPAAAPGWPSCGGGVRVPGEEGRVPLPLGALASVGAAAADCARAGAAGPPHPLFAACAATACTALQAVAPDLDALDARAGDGDCGATLAAGAARVVAALPTMPADPATALAALGAVAGTMGGTSGALASILFAGAATAVGAGDTPAAWAAALAAGVAAVQLHGGAAEGDRTLIDALAPAARAAAAAAAAGETPAAVAAAAADAATAGAAATATMAASAGRAANVRADAVVGARDAGAAGAAVWVAAVAGEVARFVDGRGA